MNNYVRVWTTWSLAGLVGCLMLAAGCVQHKLTPNATLSFDVPSKISVIEKGARVKVFTTGNMGAQTKGFVRDLTKELNEAGWFTVVSKKPFDYAMNINTFKGYRRDTDKQVPYNTVVDTTEQTDEDGNGHDVLVTTKRHSAIAAYVATISIYEAKNLEPLVYFNSVAAKGLWEDVTDPLPDDGVLEKKLANQIVRQMRNLLTSERRTIGVILPEASNPTIRDLLLQGKLEDAQTKARSLLPETPLKNLSATLYEKWAKAAKKAREQGNEHVVERDMETDLATFYLLFIAKEAYGTTEARLHEVHDGYTEILALTGDNNMIEACAHSLSRVEQNARRLNINLSPE
ncbi:MAG: hypothetical protein CSA21_02325 [Deltaproteobacteria bacterium]|nr:MAG: hypothetical protein CSA21_02325 [Deltaproteobacteria bacterium]